MNKFATLLICAAVIYSPLSGASTQPQQASQANSKKLVEKIISLVAIPASESYTNNGWNMLSKIFPQIKWAELDNKWKKANVYTNPNTVFLREEL